MAYPEAHLLLTIQWRHGAYPDESGQCGIRFHATGAGNLDATQARVDAAAASVNTFWTAPGAKIAGEYQLVRLRLARIDTTGQYVPGTTSWDHPYTSLPGGAGGGGSAPLQTACVSTLLTNVPHGQASHGRIYLPPIATALIGSNPIWATGDCDTRSSTLATMLTSLNTAITATASVYSKGTLRHTAGMGRAITKVVTGRRPDVQRRRAKGVPDVKTSPGTVVLGGDPGEVLVGGPWL